MTSYYVPHAHHGSIAGNQSRANIKAETMVKIMEVVIQIEERKRNQSGRASKKVKLSEIRREIGTDHAKPHKCTFGQAKVAHLVAPKPWLHVEPFEDRDWI